MTMLCWLYCNGKNGPIFKYKTSEKGRVTLGVSKGKLFARFTEHDPSEKATSMNTSLAGGWKLVGASYNNMSGEVKLWVDGVMVYEQKNDAGLTLSAQDNVRMGAWRDSNHFFFKGRIAQMQVYDLALTQEQIRVIQENTQRPGEKYALLNMSSFSRFYGSRQSRGLQNHKKITRPISAIVTEQAWSIKDLLYGFAFKLKLQKKKLFCSVGTSLQPISVTFMFSAFLD